MEVDKSLVPIFLKTEVPSNVEQIGTGIFIDYQGIPFLLTAAHVTDDLENGKLLVPTVNGLSEIKGYQAHLDLLPNETRRDDNIDMAYYRLSTPFAIEKGRRGSFLFDQLEKGRRSCFLFD